MNAHQRSIAKPTHRERLPAKKPDHIKATGRNLNEKELTMLTFMLGQPDCISTLRAIGEVCWPQAGAYEGTLATGQTGQPGASEGTEKSYRWAANSARKLVKYGSIRKIGRGTYQAHEGRAATQLEAQGHVVATVPTPKPALNATARWLEKQFKRSSNGDMRNSRLYRSMFVAVATKCPVSKTTLQVEDHLMTCISRLIRRDAFKARLESGQEPTASHLCTYAVRSAITDARDSATNPVCREMFGARTETERKGSKSQWTAHQKETPTCLMDGSPFSFDVAIEEEKVTEKVHFNRLWDVVLQVLEDSRLSHPERYAMILAYKINGDKAHEAALDLGVSKSRVSSMTVEIKNVMNLARKRGLFQDFLASPT